MKRNFILLTAVVFLFAIVSCQKEIENTTITSSVDDITGTWKFISFNAKTVATIEATTGGTTTKTVTTSDYTSEDNQGTVTIDAQNISYDNLSYNIKTIAHGTMYENGVKIDTFSMPIQASIPPSSSKTAYTRVGADSLYFPGGSSLINGVTQTTQQTGAKIKKEQDKLFIIQRVNQTSTDNIQGQVATTNEQAEVTVTLQKK